ncbi:MAG: anti-sigma factor family protein [Bradyrhizobium sp.]
MSSVSFPIAEDDLHSFVDGEIDDDRREAVLAYLANTPADAARIEVWRQQNMLLKAAFSHVGIEQVPASLSLACAPRLVTLPLSQEGGMRDLLPRRRRRRGLAFAVAAFVAGITVTIAANLSMNRYRAFAVDAFSDASSNHGPAVALLATAALHHRHPKQAMRQQPATWNAGAIEPALVILPSLKRQGLELLRGETGGSAEDSVNCLDFADPSGTPIVLCIAAAKPADAPEFRGLEMVSANAVYWRQGQSLYALAAPSHSERLATLARQIHALLADPQTR